MRYECNFEIDFSQSIFSLHLFHIAGIEGAGRVKSATSQVAPSKVGSRPASAEHPDPPREPTPVPESSIFMIAVEFLLEVKATQVKCKLLSV